MGQFITAVHFVDMLIAVFKPRDNENSDLVFLPNSCFE